MKFLFINQNFKAASLVLERVLLLLWGSKQFWEVHCTVMTCPLILIEFIHSDKTFPFPSCTHVQRWGSRRFWSLWHHKRTSLSRPVCSHGWPALSCGRRRSSRTSLSCGSPVHPWTIGPLHSLWKLHTQVWQWLPPPPSGPPEALWTPLAALNAHENTQDICLVSDSPSALSTKSRQWHLHLPTWTLHASCLICSGVKITLKFCLNCSGNTEYSLKKL